MAAEAWQTDFDEALRFLAAGDRVRGVALLEKVHASQPERPQVALALGRERQKQGRHVEAEGLLRGAWEQDRRLLAAAGALARCLGVHLRRFDEAHAVLDETRVDAALLVVRGELYLEENRLEEADRALDLARDLLGDRQSSATRRALSAAAARVHHQTAMALVTEGDFEAALFGFKRASDQAPRWSEPLVGMGVAFARLGRVARARSCLERALVLDPEDTQARNYLSELRRKS
jgi:tetratricopeptide (TPR) repeat protein